MNDLLLRSLRIDRELPKGSYLRQVPAIKQLQRMGTLEFTAPVSFFVGENGIGKSTLMEAIAVNLGFNAEGGSMNFRFSTDDTHSELHQYLTLSKGSRRRQDGFFLRAESFYNVASSIDRMERDMGGLLESYGGKSLHQQSHGESFLALVANRFRGNGLYLLDEPEAALSPSRILELMCHINRLVNEGSQFIISTHSPMLMAFPKGQVIQLTEKEIKSVSYEETEHFRLTKQFLADPQRMCRYLFEE